MTAVAHLIMSGPNGCYQHPSALTRHDLLVKGRIMALLSLPIVSVPVEYRDVPGFPGYRVGNDGSAWSCYLHGPKRRMSDSWRLLKQGVTPLGYRHVGLSDGNKIHTCPVHRLVLEAFVGSCPDGMECCHEDGNPSNNRLSNLRWDTPQGNWCDRRRHGHTCEGEKSATSKLTESQVREILSLKGKLGQWAIATKIGISRTQVQRILSGASWAHVSQEEGQSDVDT